ncbi:MAG: hypothetical protein CSA22_03975 [Deltaproteobacteria bacterium]|nr:MAG: hypothetical protein CSA22_03975 [Deltaproteobacteria bacterium]
MYRTTRGVGNGKLETVVQFTNVPFMDDKDKTNTFQIILEQGTNNIRVNYQSVWFRGPGKTTAGIQNENGTVGLEYHLTESKGAYFNRSVLYSYNPVVVVDNEPPIARAGYDQIVGYNQKVSLDGSNSFDPEKKSLTYLWEYIDSSGMGLNMIGLSNYTSAVASFTTPSEDRSLQFRLTVTDDQGEVDTDTMTVTVEANGTTAPSPTAEASASKTTAAAGDVVILDGSDSIHPSGGTLQYTWSQVGNGAPFVSISNSTSQQAFFTVPSDLASQTSFQFSLKVQTTDGGSDTDTVSIQASPSSNPGGSDPTALIDCVTTAFDQGTVVTLDGSLSYDSGGSIASWQWKQVSGTPVSLTDATTSQAIFQVPVSGQDELLVMQLTVTDNDGNTASTTCSVKSRASDAQFLYFPDLKCNGTWRSEIGIVNTQSGVALSGTLSLRGNDGAEMATRAIEIPNGGQTRLVVNDAFESIDWVASAVLTYTSGQAKGYVKLYQDGIGRTAYPAMTAPRRGSTIYLPHVAADENWLTVVSLFNTTDAEKTVQIAFNNGETFTHLIPAKGRYPFIIQDLMPDTYATAKTAVITGAEGIIGTEVLIWGKLMGSFVVAADQVVDVLTFPHLPSSDEWMSGVGVCNTGSRPAILTIVPFDMNGNLLDPVAETVAPYANWISLRRDIEYLPEETEWFEIRSSEPVVGFELFTTADLEQYAGLNTGLSADITGVFPLVDADENTGLVFVNTEWDVAAITLKVMSESGQVLASRNLSLSAHEKYVDLLGNYFPEASLAAASHVRYVATGAVIGMQMNSSLDGIMLDALSGL